MHFIAFIFLWSPGLICGFSSFSPSIFIYSPCSTKHSNVEIVKEGEIGFWKCEICSWKNKPSNMICGGSMRSSNISRFQYGCGHVRSRSRVIFRNSLRSGVDSPRLKTGHRPMALKSRDESRPEVSIQQSALFGFPEIRMSLKPWSLIHGQAVEFWLDGKLNLGNVFLENHGDISQEHDEYSFKEGVPLLLFDPKTNLVKSKKSRSFESDLLTQVKKKKKKQRKRHFDSNSFLNDEGYDFEKRKLIVVPYENIIGTWHYHHEQENGETTEIDDEVEYQIKCSTPKSLNEWSSVHNDAQLLLQHFQQQNTLQDSIKEASHSVWNTFHSTCYHHKGGSLGDAASLIEGQLTSSMVGVYLLTGQLQLSKLAAAQTLRDLRLRPPVFAAVHYAASYVLALGLNYYSRRLTTLVKIEYFEVEIVPTQEHQPGEAEAIVQRNPYESPLLDSLISEGASQKSIDKLKQNLGNLLANRPKGSKAKNIAPLKFPPAVVPNNGLFAEDVKNRKQVKLWVNGGGWLPLPGPRKVPSSLFPSCAI